MLTSIGTHEAFFTAFHDLNFQNYKRIVIAVSGGSDSTALLHLLAEYRAQQAHSIELLAVTVDHGLRARSGDEAMQVAGLCRQLCVRHQIMKWIGKKPETGLQAEARSARYRLLDEAAQSFHSGLVLTGHTLDDQIETLRMRMLRGQGAGLSGIARTTLYRRRTWFARPLLDARRVQLRRYLEQKHVLWVEDPSNLNERFERVRVRLAAVGNGDETSLMRLRQQHLSARVSNAQAGAKSLADRELMQLNREQSTVRIRSDVFSQPGFGSALQVLLSWIGARAHKPSQDVWRKIEDFVKAGVNGNKFTAHGCLLSVSDGDLLIARENRASGLDQFGFDYLITEPDLPLAKAIFERLGGDPLPPLPFVTASC